MKVSLISVAAVILIASVAAEEHPALRATGTSEVMAALQDNCSKGTNDGKRMIKKLYDDDCSNVLDKSWDKTVRKEQKRKEVSRPRNWKDRQYNECLEKAVKKEQQRIGRQCRNSDQAADDCEDLGKAAAKQIVEDADGVCPSGRFGAMHHGNQVKKFRKECMKTGINKCQGSIGDAVKDCGGSASSKKRNSLGRGCKDMVRSMTGRDESFLSEDALDEEDESASTIDSSDYDWDEDEEDSADYDWDEDEEDSEDYDYDSSDYDSADYDSADYDVSASADNEDEDLNEVEIWEEIWKKKMTPEEKKKYKSLSKDEKKEFRKAKRAAHKAAKKAKKAERKAKGTETNKKHKKKSAAKKAKRTEKKARKMKKSKAKPATTPVPPVALA